MTIEEQAATAAAQKADADFEAELEGLTDEEKTKKRAERDAQRSLKTEYDAELKREREARQKAESTLQETRDKARKRMEEKLELERERQGIDDDDDKPITTRQLQEMLAQQSQQIQKELQGQKIVELARSRAGSETEAALMVEVHKNRQFPPHLSIEEQMDEVWLIANRKKIMGEHAEALRAVNARANSNPAGTYYPASPEPIRGNMEVIKKLLGMGYKENKTLNRLEKKFGNGKLSIVDPNTGKVSVI